MSDYRTVQLRSEIGPDVTLSKAEVKLQEAIADGTASDELMDGHEYDPEDTLLLEFDALDMTILMPALEAAQMGCFLMEDELRLGIANRLLAKIQRTIREQKFIIIEDVP
jgi:hypothetical protein